MRYITFCQQNYENAEKGQSVHLHRCGFGKSILEQILTKFKSINLFENQKLYKMFLRQKIREVEDQKKSEFIFCMENECNRNNRRVEYFNHFLRRKDRLSWKRNQEEPPIH